jgi:hypothetical protein
MTEKQDLSAIHTSIQESKIESMKRATVVLIRLVRLISLKIFCSPCVLKSYSRRLLTPDDGSTSEYILELPSSHGLGTFTCTLAVISMIRSGQSNVGKLHEVLRHVEGTHADPVARISALYVVEQRWSVARFLVYPIVFVSNWLIGFCPIKQEGCYRGCF